ncbi:MAG: hypothetical protein Q8868_01645 [Bacteroidota bacterium]|nr:hypothetical protein [Bacteroidota bacterium]
MKKIKNLGSLLALIIIIFSCEELPDPAGLRGVAVVPAISDINPGIFDSKDLENSYVEFVITVPEGTNPDKITVLGSYQDHFERVTITEVTSYPATVRVRSSDIAQKLGIALDVIKNGDVFTLELITLAKGLATRSTAVLFIPVACAYDVDLAEGSYHSVSPDWNSEGNITLTADPDDPYKIYVTGIEEIEGLVEDQGPLVMYINPATYNVTVPEKVVSSVAWDYGSISYSGSGTYSSCDGSYTMHFDISLSKYGNQGKFLFTFTRNP